MFGRTKRLHNELASTQQQNEALLEENKYLRKDLKKAIADVNHLQCTLDAVKSGSTMDVLINYIQAEYEAARSRQRRKDAPASDYMKGLQFALEALKEVRDDAK